MKRKLKKMLIVLLTVTACLLLGACVFFQQPKFGKLPEGQKLERIEKSPNYRDGEFQNALPTPRLTGDKSLAGAIWEYLTTTYDRLAPAQALPAVEIDFANLAGESDIMIWLGHSSWFMRLNGKTILVDPVFSEQAGPFSFSNRAFAGTTLYSAAGWPELDYVLISHDHWDHLDYPSITALAPKMKRIICGLGVGAHLEHWGLEAEKIIEADWREKLELEPDLTIHVLPARHSSGRLLTRNKTLWVSFMLETPERRIYFSGDSGYGPHFQEIGEMYPQADLAILDTGQYNPDWRYSHMTPEEAIRATKDLKASALLPVHIGRFALAKHPWDEPFKRLAELDDEQGLKLLTPMIGELIRLDDSSQTFSRWWEGLE